MCDGSEKQRRGDPVRDIETEHAERFGGHEFACLANGLPLIPLSLLNSTSLFFFNFFFLNVLFIP